MTEHLIGADLGISIMGRWEDDGSSDIVKKYIDDERFETDIGLARWLAEEYPIRSVGGWRNFISRWKKMNIISPDPEYTTCEMMYVKETDTYITYLTSAAYNVVVPGPIHRAMKQAYSDMVGEGETGGQICLKFGFPDSWFDEYRRMHKWRHSMLPFTDEEVKESNPEQMVEELILRNKREIQKRYQTDRIKDLERDADKWRQFQDGVLDEITFTHSEYEIERSNLLEEPSGNQMPYALVVSPTDFHWGKYGWEDEVGETYDFEEAKYRLYSKTAKLVEMLPYSPEKIIVAVGSDWFHIDNDFSSTTAGTPQDSAGSPAEILMSGFELAKEHLELLREVAPLQIVCMGGNHDRHTSLALMMYLSASFDNCEDVEVIVNPSIRQYISYGRTLIGFTHGDKAVRKLSEVMATEKREDWGLHRFHIWFHGHLHFRKSEEKGGSTIIQMPSLAGHDRYHHRHGYVSSEAGLSAYMIDLTEGLVCSFFAPVA